jgi:hypothetical protein
MRRSIALAAVLALLGSLALVTAAVGGGFWKAPPFSAIGIMTLDGIDASFVDANTDDTVLSIFVDTGSTSRACLATLTEESNEAEDMPGVAALFCAQRTPVIDGTEHPGLLLHLFLEGPMGTGMFVINAYQEGVTSFAAPVHCDMEGC